MIGLYSKAFRHFGYRHRSLPGQQFRKNAVMFRVKMLH